ncbi:hypothetical protein DL98DRAFT_232608 [Cadophora sp. DSE1049]|nr:hypothetical protein DL98DRAFT_232608 [Cadophora sp. DSE1049]
MICHPSYTHPDDSFKYFPDCPLFPCCVIEHPNKPTNHLVPMARDHHIIQASPNSPTNPATTQPQDPTRPLHTPASPQYLSNASPIPTSFKASGPKHPVFMKVLKT